MNATKTSKTDICTVIVDRVRTTGETFSVFAAHGVERSMRPITVKAFAGPVQQGQRWVVCGANHKDPKWGDQFVASFACLGAPTTLQELQLFCTSGLIEGWGWDAYHALVDAYGPQGVFKAIEAGALPISYDGTITPEMMEALYQAWSKADTLAATYAQLADWGVNGKAAESLVKYYGLGTVDKLTADPYRDLLEIPGYGWKTAETIAQWLGIPSDDDRRLKAGLAYALQQETFQAGHTWLTAHAASRAAAALLGTSYSAVRELVDAALADGRVVSRSDQLYPLALDHAEDVITTQIAMRLTRPGLVNLQRTAGMFTGTSLSSMQLEAVLKGLTCPLSLLTGGPGTGKTTTLKTLVSTALSLGLPVSCMAPTGKAAARLAEATEYPAGTIHSKLRLVPGDTGENSADILLSGLVIVDEISMLDTQLAAAMFTRIAAGAQIVLVGDPDQLPSVGPGAILRDLLEANVIPRTHLDHVYRNEAGIAQNAARMREGKELVHFADCELIPVENASHAADRVADILQALQSDGIDPDDILVLTPTNEGPTGRYALNAALQPCYNHMPVGSGISKSLVAGETTTGMSAKRMEELRTGDRVMVTRNNRELGVFNGQIGRVVAVKAPGALDVDIDGKVVHFAGEDKRIVTLAYAITGHKAQGSEAKVVIAPIFPSRVLCREWLYTVLTRAKSRCILLGDVGAMQTAIDVQRSSERRTGLVDRLRDAQELSMLEGVV